MPLPHREEPLDVVEFLEQLGKLERHANRFAHDAEAGEREALLEVVHLSGLLRRRLTS